MSCRAPTSEGRPAAARPLLASALPNQGYPRRAIACAPLGAALVGCCGTCCARRLCSARAPPRSCVHCATHRSCILIGQPTYGSSQTAWTRRPQLTAEAFAEELKSTLGFEGLVAALLRPLDRTFDEAQTLELPSGATPAPVATLVIRVLEQPMEAAAAAAEAEDRYAISLSFTTDEAGGPAGGGGTAAAAAPPETPETLAEMPMAIGLAQARARASVAALQRCFDELRAGAGAAADGGGGRAVELMEKRRVVLGHRPLHTPPRSLQTPPEDLGGTEGGHRECRCALTPLWADCMLIAC